MWAPMQLDHQSSPSAIVPKPTLLKRQAGAKSAPELKGEYSFVSL